MVKNLYRERDERGRVVYRQVDITFGSVLKNYVVGWIGFTALSFAFIFAVASMLALMGYWY